jgi:transposase
VSEEVMDKIELRIKETPDITLVELIKEFELPITYQALSKRLLKLGYSLKKNSTSKCKGKRGRYRSKGDLGIQSEQSRCG